MSVRCALQARTIVRRILRKLDGKDFPTTAGQTEQQLGGQPQRVVGEHNLSVEHQVRRLIREATSNTNLCQHYIGWCAYW